MRDVNDRVFRLDLNSSWTDTEHFQQENAENHKGDILARLTCQEYAR